MYYVSGLYQVFNSIPIMQVIPEYAHTTYSMRTLFHVHLFNEALPTVPHIAMSRCWGNSRDLEFQHHQHHSGLGCIGYRPPRVERHPNISPANFRKHPSRTHTVCTIIANDNIVQHRPTRPTPHDTKHHHNNHKPAPMHSNG